jgi:ATP-binding cassette subfamily B protein
MRFYDINTGTLSLDNDSVTNIRRDDLRRAFTMVLQDTWIFYGTIYENITYGHENVSMEKVIEVAKKAHIHQFIESLPDGYNTKMTDDGLNISKGQRQLLVIARAMLSDAKILILDEATSNVDTYTEIKIQEAMKQLMKGKTTFVIAHRLSTIKEADQIIVLKEGQIIEIGTHESLLSQDTFYAKLFNSQFN